MTAETVMKLPDILETKLIYKGKFIDRNPDLITAGKLTFTEYDSVKSGMKPENRPPSPDVIRRFRATLRPSEGQTRVFYGKATDPERIWAQDMIHGRLSKHGEGIAPLLNPQPKTWYAHGIKDKHESIYLTNTRAPLGKSHNQENGLPRGLNPVKYTCGIMSKRDISVGELVNPDMERGQVNEEYEVGRDLYRMSHAHYLPGEQVNRQYINPHIPDRFGIPTPHADDGRHAKKSLRWLHDAESEKDTPVCSKRVDDFRERNEDVLGKVLDPIKETMKVPDDHTFGILVKPDPYGVGDLMHQRVPCRYLRGKDRIRGLIACLQQLLKKANYHNFHDLLSAFKYYDQTGTGKINIIELRDVCNKFSVPIEPELLEQLMFCCDHNRDGQINYVEFCNFLNWKESMNSGLPHKGIPLPQNDMITNKDVVQKTSDKDDMTPVCLIKQIDAAIGDHRTSSGMINAVVGGIATDDYRLYGVPSVRSDIGAPYSRRIDDRINYGDQSDCHALMNPSIYSKNGVYEEDVLGRRTKNELKTIFDGIGIQMSTDTFDTIYDMAAKQHPSGNVSVETFRSVLDFVQVADLQSRAIVGQ